MQGTYREGDETGARLEVRGSEWCGNVSTTGHGTFHDGYGIALNVTSVFPDAATSLRNRPDRGARRVAASIAGGRAGGGDGPQSCGGSSPVVRAIMRDIDRRYFFR
ncbi:hypothetical protein GCM10009819_04540 [Agromyces tropicus]|uniref:Uncharacterized protein n=1 Tax=Agromyces tropicus TaxID=555371 RepID=A0ABN2TZ34_9MICO